MSEKPVIFFSHAHFDASVSRALTEQINTILPNYAHVFNTSMRGGVGIGRDWLKDIETHIDTSRAFIVLVTPASIRKHWVWFELGAFWLKHKEEHGLYPLSLGIDSKDIPQPLSRLQIQSIDNLDGINLFYETICQDLGVGDLVKLNTTTIMSAISEHLPKYADLPKDEDELASEEYSSPYEGYSLDTLGEFIDDYLHHQYLLFTGKIPLASAYYTLNRAVNPHGRQASIFTGKIILFDQLDRYLQLPIGTSQQLLKSAASVYGLVPVKNREHSDSIRFIYASDVDQYRESNIE